ncbi:phosphoenolpyruvate-protein phosphotransferase [Candidatus Nitromaritima sp. SCGC AAA799-C22]|nr:phosphoenolpyruvate-protein phosphotransferase [Candidatus Nitromaritima sp. SCGC AAA799-C22]
MYRGIAVSKGIAIGKAYILDRSKFCIIKQKLSQEAVEPEIERFRAAIEKTKLQMQETKKRATKVAEKYAIILDTYTLLLEDDILVSDTIKRIRDERINAEWAITETLDKFTRLFNNINDDYLKGKKDDLELVVHGVIRNLFGHSQESLSEIQEPVILITHTLSPSDTLLIPRNYVLGLATEVGGKTSHVGIFASALGIPGVVGVKGLASQLNSGDPIIIDGIDGHVIVNPSEKLLNHYKTKQANHKKYEEKLLENIDRPAKTKDKFRVRLLANIESAHEIRALRKFGAEGVGLYRTEFLYLGTQDVPTEKELYENFKKVAQDLAPLPVVIRTLDIGMDKQLHTFGQGEDDNPALGLRGIRLSLAYPDHFVVQLKAILRASLYGEVKILYPMISDVEELVRANKILGDIKDEFREEQIPFNEDIEVGAMIETPSSAICANLILKEVDFISIGTNDLIQYLLAVDRINENVAHLYQPFHPSVLKTLKSVFEAAEAAGKKVSVCGELGGDPMATLFLLGLGNLADLSMDPHSIPKVKKIICQSDLTEARQLSDHVLSLSSTEEINRFLTEEMRTRFPADFSRNENFEENSKSE